MAWDRQRVGYALIGALLFAVGIGIGRANPQSSVTPDSVHGTVNDVSGHGSEISFRPDDGGTAKSFKVGGILQWQDRKGTWHGSGTPACMKPSSPGQHVTLGLASVTSSGDNPGGQVVAWIRCQ
jgi:hypothetical protein